MKNHPRPDTLGRIADDLWDLHLRNPGIDPFLYKEVERLLLDAVAHVEGIDSPLPQELAQALRRELAQLLEQTPATS